MLNFNSILHLPAESTCVQGACSQHHCAVKTSGILLDNQRLYLNRLVGWSQEMVPVHVSALFPNVAHTDCFGYMPKQQNISLVNLDKHTALAMLELSGEKKKRNSSNRVYMCTAAALHKHNHLQTQLLQNQRTSSGGFFSVMRHSELQSSSPAIVTDLTSCST